MEPDKPLLPALPPQPGFMMANTTDVTARLVRASLIGALVGSALPAFNGFTRFAHPQTALAVVGLCVAVAFAAKRAFGSGGFVSERKA